MINPNITYTWSIVNLERYVTNGIVYTAHWAVNAVLPSSEENSEDIYVGSYGSTGLEPPSEGDEFIPYEDLTPEIVINWVKEKLGEEQISSIEASLASQIDEKINPGKMFGLPWS